MDVVICVLGNVAYIIAIALQLAAAILLIGNTSIKREKVIMEYCVKNTGIVFDEDGKMLDRTVLEETVQSTWINHIAFYYLFIGYVISVFGNCTIDKIWAALVITFLVATLYVIPTKHAKTKAQNFPSITEDEIPDKNGILAIWLEK